MKVIIVAIAMVALYCSADATPVPQFDVDVDGLIGSIASLASQIPLQSSHQNRPHGPGTIEAFGGGTDEFDGVVHNQHAFSGIQQE